MVKKDKPTSAKSPKKRKAPIVDDGYLWEYVAKEVSPLRASKRRKVDKEDAISADEPSPTVPSTSSDRVLNTPSTPPRAFYGTLLAGDAKEVNRAMAKQIKSGKYPVDMKLDLHGMTQHQAHLALVNAVENAYAQGKRCLLVITGKGKFSQGGGVLKRQLPSWLNQANLRPYILMINEATQADGGSGAFYVMIRKKMLS